LPNVDLTAEGENIYETNDGEFYLNLVSFLVLLGLSASGIIIALPHEHGPNEAKPLGIGRRQWGDIHLWLGITSSG
jgi:hypothetical protein